MTVVAALKIEGIPALIGDFLITDEQRGTGHVWLPTRPNLNDPRYPKLPRRISGFRRKLHLINERFIVGFTGTDINAGGEVFADLERRFGNSNTAPSITKINQALQLFNIKFHRSGQTTIVIGWTCGSRPRCFRWEAGLGSSAMPVGSAIEGSGRDHFRRVLTNSRTPGYPPAVKTAVEKATLLGLAKVGAVLTEELSTATNLMASYGYGAEIALYIGNRFQFIPKLGYLFWNTRIELDGSVTIMPSNVGAVYEARGKYSLLAVTHLSPGKESGVLNADNTYVQILTPLHDNLSELVLTAADAPTHECSYYFNGIMINDTRSNLSGRIHFSVPASKDAPFRVHKREQLFYFEWDRKMLETMILSAADMMMKAAQRPEFP